MTGMASPGWAASFSASVDFHNQVPLLQPVLLQPVTGHTVPAAHAIDASEANHDEPVEHVSSSKSDGSRVESSSQVGPQIAEQGQVMQVGYITYYCNCFIARPSSIISYSHDF